MFDGLLCDFYVMVFSIIFGIVDVINNKVIELFVRRRVVEYFVLWI